MKRAGSRSGAAVVVLAAMLSCTSASFAQPYPSKPLRFVIPFPGQGGGGDYVGRVVGQKFAERLGQPVVIENRPGAGGNIGNEIVAKAAPDGYTILVASPSLTISPSLYKKLSYDPLKDLAPIALVAEIPNLILIRSSLPAKTLKEFIEYAKARPGKLNFGGSGVGSSGHLATVLFTSLAGIDLVSVAYKGSAQALIAMLSGEIDFIIIGPTVALPHVQSGRVRALAVLRDKRLPSLPNVPTITEAGVDNSKVTTWYGLLAPAGTPRTIVERLNGEWLQIAAMPDTIEKMRSASVEIMTSTTGQFATLMKTEVARWAKVVKPRRPPKLPHLWPLQTPPPTAGDVAA